MTISNAALKRQIAREGKRWGLVPVERDGRVFVAQMVDVAHASRGAGMGSVWRKPQAICSIDEDHPFSAALNNRIGRAQVDLAERAAERDAALAAEDEKRVEDIKHTYAKDFERISRERIVMLPPLMRR